MFTLRAAYHFNNRWIAEMKLNRVQAFGGPDTTALLLGIGYQLDAPEAADRMRVLCRGRRTSPGMKLRYWSAQRY